MTQQEKLKKIIERAIKQGYFILYPTIELTQTNFEVIKWGEKIEIEISNEGFTTSHDLNTIIFDHSFAKAYWGKYKRTICCQAKRIKYKNNEMICEACGLTRRYFDMEYPYLYHLQQLAIAEDRIKYLYKFIDG